MGFYGGTILFYGKVDDGEVNPDYKTLEYRGKKYLYHKDGYLTKEYCSTYKDSSAFVCAFGMTTDKYELNIPGFSWMYYFNGSDTYGDGGSVFNSYSNDIKEVQLPERTDNISTQLEVNDELKIIEKFCNDCGRKCLDVRNFPQTQEIKEFLIKHDSDNMMEVYNKLLNKEDNIIW